MENVAVKLPDDLYAKVVELSQRRGTAKSDVIRDALETYFTTAAGGSQMSCTDLAGDLVGSVVGPSDLATNRKHLRGYGR